MVRIVSGGFTSWTAPGFALGAIEEGGGSNEAAAVACDRAELEAAKGHFGSSFICATPVSKLPERTPVEVQVQRNTFYSGTGGAPEALFRH